MLNHKLKLVVITALALAAVATGAGWLARSLAMREEPVRDPNALVAQAAPRQAAPARPQPAPDPAPDGRMTVTGRVLRPDGQPAAGVPVDIIGSPRAPEAGTDVERESFVILGQGSTDAEGRFRIEAARASSARFYEAYALAGSAGPGSAFGCVKITPGAEQPTAEVPLQPEQPIRGRLVDVSGQPAAGVEVQLKSVYSESTRLGGRRFDGLALVHGYVWRASSGGLRAWPKAVTTDGQGRFTFNGVGRGLYVSLAVRDPRFAQQRLDVQTDQEDGPKEMSAALQPSKIIEGRVLAADNGRPIPEAVISVRASTGLGGGMFTTKFRADDQGRFRINPYAGDYFRMRAIPPEGQPYLPREAEFEWTKGAVKRSFDLTLPRGVPIQGRVTEHGTGRPVAGASIQFFPQDRSGDVLSGFEAIVRSRDDGSFRLAVPPGKGYLMIMGPTLDFIPERIAGGQLYASGQRGGMPFYAHGIIAYDVKAGESPHELTAALRPGKTLRGRMVGPAGETVEDAVILSRQQLDPINLTWQNHHFVRARDGRFELHGLDPEKSTPVYFLDADHGWGAVVELSGRQAGEEVTVRLQPCGQAKARFVGPDGQPVAKFNVWPYLHLLMTPGAVRGFSADRGEQLTADEAFLPNVDPQHYPNSLATGAEGRVILPALIPGAPYRISDWSTANVQGKGIQLRKDFTVKPGESVDLGDILVEKPRN